MLLPVQLALGATITAGFQHAFLVLLIVTLVATIPPVMLVAVANSYPLRIRPVKSLAPIMAGLNMLRLAFALTAKELAEHATEGLPRIV